jgi:hypothetical protein
MLVPFADRADLLSAASTHLERCILEAVSNWSRTRDSLVGK